MSIKENNDKKRIDFDSIFRLAVLPVTVLLSTLFSFNSKGVVENNFLYVVIVTLSFLNVLLAYFVQRTLNRKSSWAFYFVMLYGAVLTLEGGLFAISAINDNKITYATLSSLVLAFGAFTAIYYYRRASFIDNGPGSNDSSGESVLA